MAIGIVTQWNEAGAGYVGYAYARVLSSGETIHIYHRGKIDCNRPQIDLSITCSLDISYYRAAPSLSKKFSDIDLVDLKKWIDLNHITNVLFNEQHFWIPVLYCKSIGLKIGAYIDYYTPDTVLFFWHL